MKSQTIIVLTEEQTKEKAEVFKKILESDEMSKELKDKVRYFISEIFEMDIEQVEVDFNIFEEEIEIQKITKAQAEAIERVRHNKEMAIIGHLHGAWKGRNSVLLSMDLRTFIVCLFGYYYIEEE